MKILYFPGLAHVVEKSVNTKNSLKYIHLAGRFHVDIYPYSRTPELSDIKGYDALVGSSFGGYFALNMAARKNITGIAVNPSFYLDKRIRMLKVTGDGLDHIDEDRLITLKCAESLKKNGNMLHVFMNMDDDVIEPSGIKRACTEHGINFYQFDSGGHEAHNFEKDMMPVIMEILR
ncbi:MAG: YqiA/YcfP family alpha/beta fold hydrolase [Deferribacterales bacterium]